MPICLLVRPVCRSAATVFIALPAHMHTSGGKNNRQTINTDRKKSKKYGTNGKCLLRMGLYSEKFTWIRWNYYYFFHDGCAWVLHRKRKRKISSHPTDREIYFFNFLITAKFSLLPVHRFIDECAWKQPANGLRRVMINLNCFTGSIIVSGDWIWFSLMNYKFSFDQASSRAWMRWGFSRGAIQKAVSVVEVGGISPLWPHYKGILLHPILSAQQRIEIFAFDSRPNVNQSLDLHKVPKSNSNLFRAVQMKIVSAII